LFGLRGVYLHLSVIIYSSGFMLFSLNVMRQSLAVAVIFVFVAFLLRGWVWRFLIGCVLAMQFHVSAIAMSFLVFVRKFLASYLVLFSIIFISLFSFLGSIFYDFSKLFAGLALYVTGYEKYYNYVNNLESGSLGFGAALRAAFYAVLSLYFFFYRRNYNKKTVFIVSIMMLGVSFSSLSAVNFMWNRVGAYFIVFESLGAPFIIKGVKDRDLRAMFFVGAWGMAMIFMLFSLVLAGEESSLHYKNILFL